MPNEIELKLRVAPEDIARLQRHRLVKSGSPPETRKLVSIYYDTPELELNSKKIALRIRREASRWIQTIKDGGTVIAGMHRRGEWEYAVAKQALDFTKLDDAASLDLFRRPALREKLRPIFVTEFSRTRRVLDFDGAVIEYCLDRGEVRSEDRSAPISEVELELKSGSPSKLFEIAIELQRTIPLKIENISKAERGYALFSGKSGNRVMKTSTPQITRKMPLRQTFREIIAQCLDQLQTNSRGFSAADPDPEYLHQMRVALRRMRSAFVIFSDFFGKEPFAELLPGLKRIAGELGQARDWDVFTLDTLPRISAEFPDAAGLVDLQRAAAQIREIRRTQARGAIESDDCQKLMLSLGLGLCDASWPQGDSPPSILEFSRAVLERRLRALKKRGKQMPDLGSEELHELRIAAKKLRYATEFFSSLYPRKASRPFLAAMTALQDDLGTLNDAAITHELLAELKPGNAAAARLVEKWIEQRARRKRAELGMLWSRFTSTQPFWS